MQALLNFAFDLDTAAGRAEFQRMFQHLVTSDPPPVPDLPAEAQAEAAPTGRQAAAAKARAAKAAKAAEVVGAPIENGEDLSGPPLNGADAEADDIGLVDPGMSPAEAKEAALAIVRQIYEAGHVAQIKALQATFGIVKFYDLPDEKGHDLHQQAMKLAHETGLRK
jgi:hypothetical protein